MVEGMRVWRRLLMCFRKMNHVELTCSRICNTEIITCQKKKGRCCTDSPSSASHSPLHSCTWLNLRWHGHQAPSVWRIQGGRQLEKESSRWQAAPQQGLQLLRAGPCHSPRSLWNWSINSSKTRQSSKPWEEYWRLNKQQQSHIHKKRPQGC